MQWRLLIVSQMELSPSKVLFNGLWYCCKNGTEFLNCWKCWWPFILKWCWNQMRMESCVYPMSEKTWYRKSSNYSHSLEYLHVYVLGNTDTVVRLQSSNMGLRLFPFCPLGHVCVRVQYIMHTFWSMNYQYSQNLASYMRFTITCMCVLYMVQSPLSKMQCCWTYWQSVIQCKHLCWNSPCHVCIQCCSWKPSTPDLA